MNNRKMMINVIDYNIAQLVNPTDNLKCDVLKIGNQKFIFKFGILDRNDNIPVWVITSDVQNGKRVITNIHTPYMAKKLYSDTDKLFNYGTHSAHMVKGFFVSNDYRHSVMNYFFLKKQAQKKVLMDEIANSRKKTAEKEEQLSKLN